MKKLSKKHFSFIYPNFPAMSHYYINKKVLILDEVTENYNEYIQAFLQKRRPLRQEIPPKLSVLKIPSVIENLNLIQKPNCDLISFEEEILRYFFDKSMISTQYIYNIFFDQIEFNFFRNLTRIQILNGYTIKLEDSDNYFNEILPKVSELEKIFYKGEQMTVFEKTLETIYLMLKHHNYNFQNRFVKNNSIIFTENDSKKIASFLNLNNSLKHPFPFSNWESFNFQKINEIWNSINNQKKTFFGLNFLKSEKPLIRHYNNNQFIAKEILAKLLAYLESEDFQKNFDTEFDFYINHSIFSMHIWLICQRLQNFKRSKNATEIIQELLKQQKAMSNKEFENVDTLRKQSKFRNIEEMFEDQKNMLHWHFNINNITHENPFFKIDAFVWSYIWREKIDRYDPRIYKMSHYLIEHFELFKTLTLEDFKTFNFDFNVNRIPINFIETIEKINPKLNEEIYFKEKFSDFKIKLYSYYYKTEKEKEEIELRKTFLRYNNAQNIDKESLYLRSRRKEEELYDELKDENRAKIEQEQFKTEFISDVEHDRGLFSSIFKIWRNKHLGKIINECEREDKERERGNYFPADLRYLKDKKRFSEMLGNQAMKERLYVYRLKLMTNKNALKDEYVGQETKNLYPDSNVITKRRKKTMVERIFRL